MRTSLVGALALVAAGLSWSAVVGDALAQGATAPQSPGMGSASDSGPTPEEGMDMRHDPQSGTMVPDPGKSAPVQEGQPQEGQPDGPRAGSSERAESRSRMQGMAQVPAGIGERGTGQTQSSLERSGIGGSPR